MSVQETIGFIGIGRMGFPMAEHLARFLQSQSTPQKLYIWNRTKSNPQVQQLLKEHSNVELVDTPRAMGAKCSIVISILADDAALASVASDENGLIHSLQKNAIHLDLSTVYPGSMVELAPNYEAKGAHLVSGCVWGRPEAAAAKKLWVGLSGNSALFPRVTPYLEAIGQGFIHAGDNVSDVKVLKLTGNMCTAAFIETLAESITIAEKAGVKREVFQDMVSKIFPIPITNVYVNKMVNDDYSTGFTASLARKDVSHILKLAHENGVEGTVLEPFDGRLKRLTEMGEGHLDWSAVTGLVRMDAGLPSGFPPTPQ